MNDKANLRNIKIVSKAEKFSPFNSNLLYLRHICIQNKFL